VIEVVAAFALPLSGTRTVLLAVGGIVLAAFGVVMFVEPGDGAIALLALVAAFAFVRGTSTSPWRSSCGVCARAEEAHAVAAPAEAGRTRVRRGATRDADARPTARERARRPQRGRAHGVRRNRQTPPLVAARYEPEAAAAKAAPPR
jgi:hypothetical protein